MTELPVVQTAYTTCPLCEATCGLALTMSGDADHRGPRRPGRRVQPRLHLPQGRRARAARRRPRPAARPAGPPRRRAGGRRPGTRRSQAVAAGLGARHRRGTGGTPSRCTSATRPCTRWPVGCIAGPLRAALGSRNVYTASTVDQMPKHVSCGYLFGAPAGHPGTRRRPHRPPADPRRRPLLLQRQPVDRARPARAGCGRCASAAGGWSWSTRGAAGPRGWPTGTWPIRPGTDVYLLLGLVHELFAAGLVALGRLRRPRHRRRRRRASWSRPRPPEAMAPRCGIDAERDPVAGRVSWPPPPRAAVYGRIGTTTVPAGTVTSWLVDVLNVLTGNLDRPGGAMFPLPAHGRRGRGTGPRLHRRALAQPGARAAPRCSASCPAVDPGRRDRDAGRRAGPGADHGRRQPGAVGTGRRPARRRAVHTGLHGVASTRTSTRPPGTRDVILPPPPPAEQSHYDVSFYHFAVRNVANFSPPVRRWPRARWTRPTSCCG